MILPDNHFRSAALLRRFERHIPKAKKNFRTPKGQLARLIIILLYAFGERMLLACRCYRPFGECIKRKNNGYADVNYMGQVFWQLTPDKNHEYLLKHSAMSDADLAVVISGLMGQAPTTP